MKKYFLLGVSFIILMTVLGSTLLIQNTANQESDFTQPQILEDKDCPIFEASKASYEDVLPAKSKQPIVQTVSEKNLEDQSLAELTQSFLHAIDNMANAASIIKIAQMRKQKMEDAIRNNPELAIQWSIESEVRESLPDEIKRYVERQIDNTASTSMFAAGGDQPHQENLRTLMVKGQTFHAFVYGNRLDQAVFDQEPVEGIALGNLMAVEDDTIQTEQTFQMQEPQEVQTTHTFYFDPGEVSFERRETFDVVYMVNSVPGESSPGSPSLPTRLVSIEIPPGATVLYVSGQGNESVFRTGMEIFPAQPQVPTSQSEAVEFVEPNPDFYNSPKKFPSSVAVHDGTQRVRGKTYVTLRLNPLRYIPETKELYFSDSIQVTVDYLTPAIPPASPNTDSEEMFDAPLGFLSSGKENDQMLDSPLGSLSGETFNSVNLSDFQQSSVENDAVQFKTVTLKTTAAANYKYLIITDSGLADAFQALADHRQSYNSFTTKILTIDEINDAYDGTRPDGKSDTQTKIRNAIADYVQNYGTIYVVLGGDNTIVPDRDTYVSCGSYGEKSMPTDLYYAGLDSTWDQWDNDGTYGESYVGNVYGQNEDDLSADVMLGRIPIRTAAQVTDYINKVIAYETNPPHDILKKVLFGGDKLWNTYKDSNRPDEEMTDGHMQFLDSNHTVVSDAEIWDRRMYRDVVQNYFNDNQISYLFDTLTSWDNGTAGSYTSGKSNMITRFNEGWNFMTYNTHGNTSIWGTESGHFNDSHAYNLNKLTAFVYTIACITGAFDRERALSEGFIRNPNGGAIVYMGCSRYGWGSPGSYHGGTSIMFQRKFYEIIFKDKITNVAEAFYAHKAFYSPYCSYNGSYRWVQFGMNLQGDPAVEIKGIIDNKPPEANDQDIVINMDTQTAMTLDATDPDSDQLTYHLVSAPAHGSLTPEFGKNMFYTPDAAYIGPDSFTYEVNDGEYTSRVATVNIQVISADNEPPTQPENLVAQTSGESTITLQWTASTDNNDIVSYDIFRNGNLAGNTEEAAFVDSKLDSSTLYQYQVQAVDQVGNRSQLSDIVDIQTIAEVFPPDGIIPANFKKKGSYGWHVCDTEASTGNKSLRADDIGDYGRAQIEVKGYFEAGIIQFDYLVSCANSDYNYLAFYIDRKVVGKWSGIMDTWETESYKLDEGEHILLWEYRNYNYGVSEGEDTGWIDNVELPSILPTGILTMNINGSGTTTPQVGSHSLVTETSHTLEATPDPGHAFDKWTCSDEVIINDPNAQSTSFIMKGDVDVANTAYLITANFIQTNNPPQFDQEHYILNPINEDTQFTLDISTYASDSDVNDILSFEKISGPQWLAVVDNRLQGTPTNNDVGINTFVIRVMDSVEAKDDATFEIQVTNVNDAPSFISQTLTGDPAIVDQEYQFSVVSFATDPDENDILTFSKAQGPEWLTLSENGTISGIPTEMGEQSFEIKVTDQAGASDTASLLITIKDDQSQNYSPGITVAYYDFTSRLASLPNFIGQPDVVRIENNVNYQKSRNEWADLDRVFRDTYASIHDGFILIEDAGEYTFFLKSDDGSRLWINGVSIIVNDGLHGMREKSGKVYLESGYHHFRIHFFENYGHTGLILSYQSDDMSKQVVPSEVLFHSTENMQPTITSKQFNIFDQQVQGALIGTMDATDANLMDQLTYSIDNQDNVIGIDPKTGELFVNDPEQIKQNVGNTLSLTIKVTDNGDPALSNMATAWISVDELKDYTPGVRSEFFDFTEKISKLQDLSSKIPDVVRTDETINYPSTRNAWEGLSDNFKDTFASRHTGFIYIATEGTYTFYLKSDDGSKLLMDHQLIIDNDGLHGMREKKSTLTLTEGFHPICIEFFENRGGAGLIFSYQGPDFNKRVVPASVLFQTTKNLAPTLADQTGFVLEGQESGTIVAQMKAFDGNFEDEITYAITDGNHSNTFEIDASTGEVSILAAQALDKAINPIFVLQISATDNGTPAISDTAKLSITVYGENDYIPGVQSEFFNETKRINQLPDLTDRTPDIKRTDAQINFTNTSQTWQGLPSEYKSNYASRHTGYLYIDTPAVYTFYLNSDDGSKLWIDGELIVDNKGLHAMRERAAMVEMGQGYHHIRIEYFERTGWAGLILSYSSEFITKQVIPASMLYHTKVQDAHGPVMNFIQVIANIGITEGEEEWLETDYDDEDTWFVEDYSLEDIEE